MVKGISDIGMMFKEKTIGSRKTIKLLGILVAIIILAVTGWFVATYMIKNSQPYKYTYAKLDSYKMQGVVEGSGISFSKPTELTVLSSGNGQIELEHLITTHKNKKAFAAYLAAASTTESSAYTQDQLMALKINFAYPNTSYSKVISPISQFLKDRLPLDWQIKLDNPKPFTNSYVRDNAWMFSFTASDPNKKKNPIYGEILYAISGKNYYYFVSSSISYNWQPNQKIWQKVVDSLQINQ